MTQEDLQNPDWVESTLEELEPWREDAWERAKNAEGDSQKNLESLASEELSDSQWTLLWELFGLVESLLGKAAVDQIQKMPAEYGDLAAEIDGWLARVWLRILATYEHYDGASLTGYAYAHTQRAARRFVRSRDKDNRDGKIEWALTRLKGRLDRSPSMEEKMEAARTKLSREMSDELLKKRIAELERAADKSLSDRVGSDTASTARTLEDVLPSGAVSSIDTRRVGRRIAKETNREELWEALLGNEPASRSFSGAMARVILLELHARRADPQQLAREHSTSPFVVHLIAESKGPYEADVSDEEVSKYRSTQGYDPRSHVRALNGEEVENLREDRREGHTYDELANRYSVSSNVARNACRGEAAYSHLGSIEPEGDLRGGSDRALSERQVNEIRARYESENISQKKLAGDYPCSRKVIGEVVRHEGAYSDSGEGSSRE